MLALALAAAAGTAQTVYRCGPEGREYSQTPCKDGRTVDVADPRSAAQRREAQQAVEDQKRLNQQLASERRQREAAAQGQAATGIVSPRPADAAAPAAAARSTKSGKPTAGDKASSTTARVQPPPKNPAR